MVFRRSPNKNILAWIAGLLCAAPCALYADGLPGEFILTQRWRDLLMEHSALSNPAFLAAEPSGVARGAYATTVGGAFRLWEVGATLPVGLRHTVGVSWVGEDDGDIESAGFDAQSGEMLSSGASVSNQNHFGLISYAINPIDRLALGVSVSVLRFGNFGKPSMGYGLDCGATYTLPQWGFLDKNMAGLMLQNLVAPKLGDGALGTVSPAARLSWLVSLWNERIESGLELSVKDFFAKSSDFSGDVSFFKRMEPDVTYRLGAWIARAVKVYGLVGPDYWGVALGASIDGEGKTGGWSALYQYLTLFNNSDAPSNTFYVVKEFGSRRGVSSSSRGKLALDPSDLYNKAMRLYRSGQYWDAYFVFSKILTKYPRFFKNDFVAYYRGSCLEELDMRKKAIEAYTSARTFYPKSSTCPAADLGLMRLYYRNGSVSEVATQYQRLSAPQTPDSIRFHALYLMGSADLQRGDNNTAAQLLGRLPSDHPQYLFARHSQAIAAARLGDKVQTLMALDKCANFQPEGYAQTQIVNRSLLLLGFAYYEEKALPKAVLALRAVSRDSYYRPDALLGLGWCAVRARNKDNCIETGEQLASSAVNGVSRLEGKLIEAYGHFIDKNYTKTAAILDNAMAMLDTMAVCSQDSLMRVRKQYAFRRDSYDSLSEAVDDLSKTGDAFSDKRFDLLHAEQVRTQVELKNRLRGMDELNRTLFFSRGMEAVSLDIRYFDALVKNIMARSGQIDEAKKSSKENAEIDKQIKSLEHQLDNMKDGTPNR